MKPGAVSVHGALWSADPETARNNPPKKELLVSDSSIDFSNVTAKSSYSPFSPNG